MKIHLTVLKPAMIILWGIFYKDKCVGETEGSSTHLFGLTDSSIGLSTLVGTFGIVFVWGVVFIGNGQRLLCL